MKDYVATVSFDTYIKADSLEDANERVDLLISRLALISTDDLGLSWDNVEWDVESSFYSKEDVSTL